MIDIVIPNNNEEEFIAIAEKLGYKALCFLYNPNNYLDRQKKFLANKIKVYTGLLADSKNIHKTKNKLKNAKTFVAIRSSNNDKDIIEKSKADVVFFFEDNAKKDFIHQRASGLNHILCKSAKENNVIIGFSVSSILNTEKKHIVLGRIMQNIQLCEKFKVKTIIASFAQNPFLMRSTHDLISLFEVLGFKKPVFLKEENTK